MFHHDRYSRYRFGLLGELVACMCLWAKGYRVLGRRIRNHGGEIDIIAKRRNCLVFVEVKSRNCFGQLAYAVTPKQHKNIVKAATIYLQQHQQYQDYDVRFDVVLVSPYRLPIYLEDAW